MTAPGDAAPSGTVYLARHGETEWNRIGRWQGKTDIPLNDVGREQARALAARLAGRGLAAVHASTLGRARETAEIVAAALGLPPPRLDPDLAERGFGCFEGLTGDECGERFPEAWAIYRLDKRTRPPGAEAQEDVTARMLRAMSIAAGTIAAPDAPVLVISHGGALRAFIAAVTGATPPPVANGVLLRATVDAGRFLDFHQE